MAAPVKPIPKGFHTVTPYVVADGAERVIRFAKSAFQASLAYEPLMRPDGKVAHAELRIGDSTMMLSDASERAPAAPVMLYVYVPDVDAVYRSALQAGAMSFMQPALQFYGDRSGGVVDPAGNRWFIGTHVEDVSPTELKKRAAAAFRQQTGAA